jgi:hypothetical protein
MNAPPISLLDSLRKLASRLFDDETERLEIDAALCAATPGVLDRLEQRMLMIAGLGKVDLGLQEFRALLPEPEGAAMLVVACRSSSKTEHEG